VISRLVAWCTRQSWIVIAVAIAVAAGGEWARRSLSRDAVPDLSDPQVGLVVDWMGHPATEVATKVTQVLTESFKSIPGSTAVRGSSMAGMAYVDVVFGSAESLEPGRQEIFRLVANLRYRLPPNIRLQIGPAASSTGWIFQYALVDPSRPRPMPIGRQLQEELLRPALAAIPGVAEVASVGETVQELVLETEPDRLRARGVAFSDVVAAARADVRGAPDLQRIETLPLPVLGDASARRAPSSPSQKVAGPIPGSRPPENAGLKIGDVAHATIAPDMPIGIADFGGTQATIGGIVVAQRDADPKTVIENVKRTLAELRPRLPRGIEIVTIYDRLDLANRVEHTLLRALTEEVAVVVLVILLFLLHAPSALAPLLTLPMVLFLTFAGMRLLGVPATIMSLGGIGIALGMAVDAEVVALEACHRRIEGLGTNASAGERRAAIVAAAGTIAPAILTSLLITALSFLPVFAFTGETGRLLRPLAITKTLVIVSAAVVAVTLAPALRDRLLRDRVPPEFDNPITRRLVRIYRPFVHFALARPALTLLTAAFAIVSCLPIVTRLGGEFLPRVDEGDLLFMPTTLPGVSAGEAAVQLRRVDQTGPRARLAGGDVRDDRRAGREARSGDPPPRMDQRLDRAGAGANGHDVDGRRAHARRDPRGRGQPGPPG
jgi:Cu(I)/Ag(I) efflux system membrane protein CusA/SilA